MSMKWCCKITDNDTIPMQHQVLNSILQTKENLNRPRRSIPVQVQREGKHTLGIKLPCQWDSLGCIACM